MKDKEKAIKFAQSIRGQYILSQALTKAIKVMEKEPRIKKELSNIADMKYLVHNLFPIFYAAQKAQKEYLKQQKKEKNGRE